MRFHEKKISKILFLSNFCLIFFTELVIAPNGATVRESVFKMEFRALSREFESIETSLGFAQLLGENWI